MKCFRCAKEEEQMLAINNKELGFKETVCFPCVIKSLKDHKKVQAEEIMKKIMEDSK